MPIAVLRFTSVIKLRDPNPYIPITPAQAKVIKPGWRKPLPVLVRINGKPAVPWRINMMPVGDGGFYLYLHGDVRRASGTKFGDCVEIELGFDAKYRNCPQHPMLRGSRRLREKNPQALKNWEALIPSRKNEILRYFARLKSPEARERNLERALRVLSGRKGRFMARARDSGA